MGQKADDESKDSPTKTGVRVRIRPESAVDVVESVRSLAKADGWVSVSADVAGVLLSFRDDHGSLIVAKEG